MTPKAQSLALLVTLLLHLLINIDGNSIPKEVNKDVTIVSSSLPSPELGPEPNAVVNQIRPIACGDRPWICSQGEFPPRGVCCGNRCVDITSDVNNCGLCGIRCSFNWQCCNRLCLNTNLNPLNCGVCGRICPFGRICLFGLCAYSTPTTPVVPLTPPPPTEEIPPPVVLPPQFPPENMHHKQEPQQAESPSQPPIME